MLCHAVFWHALSCSVVFCDAMFCHALFCHALLRSVLFVEGEGGIRREYREPGDLAAAVCRAGGPGGLLAGREVCS